VVQGGFTVLRRFFQSWVAQPNRSIRRKSNFTRTLRLEPLEAREVLSVTLATISQPTIPNDKPIFIPVNVTNVPNGDVNYSVVSENSNVAASVVSGGRSVRFDVSGTDSNGVQFSGSITVRLFADAAPNAAQRIIDLVNSGYYNGKTFPRIINNFMIQGGGLTTSDNSPLGSFADEFNADYTFDSPGILAMANSGDDTNNSQFFITDPKVLLAQRHQDLNFNYSIVGILTDGFDIYQKIITTPVVDNGNNEVSKPTNTVTINSATVFDDKVNAVIKLVPNSSFGTGSVKVDITATDLDGPTDASFTSSGVDDGVNSPPFISTPIPNQTTTAGASVSFNVSVTDIDGDATTIAVKDTAFSTTTIPNATVSIDQTTKRVTITPAAGFTGTIQFKVGVRPTSAADTAANYDTQLVTLTVNPATSNGGGSTGNGFTVQGAVAGTAPVITVLNADGTPRWTKTVFDPSFTGGVLVATGDINGDGVKDVIIAPGFGGGGVIQVLDSVTGNVFRTITFFANNYRGGVSIDAGDANALGYDQIIVGAGNTGGPRVMVLDLKQNKMLQNFFVGDSSSRGGVGSVDLSDVFKDKGQDIVVGTGVGLAPQVYVFKAASAQLIGNFPPGSEFDTNGLRVRAGDQDATTGVRPLFVAPVLAPAGSNEKQFDPSQFMNPDSPIG
jgi:cyclophilin family peptidyl-prolyl cis-trans isomerase